MYITNRFFKFKTPLFWVAILLLVIFMIPQNNYSQLWRPIGPCYDQEGCTISQNSQMVDLMGCTVTVMYQVITCGTPPNQTFQYQIDQFSYSSGGNCANLHLYLHPLPGNALDPDKYADAIQQLYAILFLGDFNAKKNNYHCPNYVEYRHWWPGSCAMACETILVNGRHVFHTLSCQELACCGHRYLYCYNPQTEEIKIDDFTFWAGTACPPQTRPYIERCPLVGDYFDGVLITDNNTTYCISNCYEN
ncbi:MAG TPA: hypothetical protein PLE30_11380 [Candidatus Kapabacteria bacterium]|nr:hypothetical protein [Candidatus Kapabacteria bacterium]